MYWLIILYTFLVICSGIYTIFLIRERNYFRNLLINYEENHSNIVNKLTKKIFRKNDGVWVLNTENFNPNIRYYLKRTEDEGQTWYLSTKPNGEGFEIPGKVSYNNLSIKAPSICECCGKPNKTKL